MLYAMYSMLYAICYMLYALFGFQYGHDDDDDTWNSSPNCLNEQLGELFRFQYNDDDDDDDDDEK